MLVLSRKPGEKVLIGENVAVTVIEVRGNRVKLGFDCPADVSVLRGELRQFAFAGAEPARSSDVDESPFYPEFA